MNQNAFKKKAIKNAIFLREFLYENNVEINDVPVEKLGLLFLCGCDLNKLNSYFLILFKD